MAKKKRKTHQISNPEDRRRQQLHKANKLMQEAWGLIYCEDKDERRRRLENSDMSYSPVERDE